MKSDDETFEIDVTVKAVTAKALLVILEDLSEEWVPKSQIQSHGDINAHARKDDSGTMIVSEWIARQKGWA